jgi:hypothetical protein
LLLKHLLLLPPPWIAGFPGGLRLFIPALLAKQLLVLVIPEVSTMVKKAAQWSRKTSYSIAGLGTEIFHRDLLKETCQRPVKGDLSETCYGHT